jgi:hypothetical protein
MRPRYQHRDLTIKALVEHARGDATGLIAVPDIQRPFVWGTREVRSLLASVLAGVPIGGMLFGRGADGGDQTVAGKQVPGQRASDAAAAPNRWRVLDGRQRLTALSIGFQPFIQRGGSAFIQTQPVWFLQLDGVLDDLSVLESAEDLEDLLVNRRWREKPRAEGTRSRIDEQLEEQPATAEGGRLGLWLPLPWLLPFATQKPAVDLGRCDALRRALSARIGSEAADSLLDTLVGRLTQHAVPVTILHERGEEFERQAFARLNSTGIRLNDLDLNLAHHGLRADLDSLTAVNRLFEGTPHPQLIKLLFAMHPDRPRPDRLDPEANQEGVASNAREAASANASEVRRRIGEVDSVPCTDASRTLLRDLGLCSMEDSPVEKVTHAAIGVMAEMLSRRTPPAQRLDRGISATGIRAWWWARTAEQVECDERPSVAELMGDLRQCIGQGFAGWNRDKESSQPGALNGPAKGRRRELLVALLRSLKLPDLEHGGAYDLQTHQRDWELHHMFPQALLNETLLPADHQYIDNCANLTLISPQTNKLFGRRPPSWVLDRLLGSSDDAPGADRTHLLESHGIAREACRTGDYAEMLKARQKWLAKQLLVRMTIVGAPDAQRSE